MHLPELVLFPRTIGGEGGILRFGVGSTNVATHKLPIER